MEWEKIEQNVTKKKNQVMKHEGEQSDYMKSEQKIF
jgi:hypothetical protein